MPLQFRQAPEADRLSSGMVLAEGELFYALDSRIWYAGDGSTPGGIPLTDQLAGFAINHGLVRSVAISTAAAATGVVTIVCAGSHGLEIGQDVMIVGATGVADLNAIHAVTGTPTSSSFTFALAIPNQSATAETGIVHCLDAQPPDSAAVVFDAAESEWVVRPITTADVTDIDSSSPPADGEALVFDSGTSKYGPAAVSAVYAVTMGGVGETTPPTDGTIGDLWAPEDGSEIHFCTDSGPPAAWERLAFASELP
jgi:hypothetical protein